MKEYLPEPLDFFQTTKARLRHYKFYFSDQPFAQLLTAVMVLALVRKWSVWPRYVFQKSPKSYQIQSWDTFVRKFIVKTVMDSLILHCGAYLLKNKAPHTLGPYCQNGVRLDWAILKKVTFFVKLTDNFLFNIWSRWCLNISLVPSW